MHICIYVYININFTITIVIVIYIYIYIYICNLYLDLHIYICKIHTAAQQEHDIPDTIIPDPHQGSGKTPKQQAELAATVAQKAAFRAELTPRQQVQCVVDAAQAPKRGFWRKKWETGDGN
jgi:hypothetical protein